MCIRDRCLVLEYLAKNKNKKLSQLYLNLKTSYQSPTMAPFCEDDIKYSVVDEIITKISQDKDNKTLIADQQITELNKVNGIRFRLANGSWGLIRASSNKPSLVVVIESLTSNEETKTIFSYINKLLNETGKVGEYDQTL